jgi:nucleotide-binding universal stress UspA family protein
MKNILLPTDFSENSYNAIKYGVQLLQDEECTFYVLNTYTPILYDNEYLVYSASQPTLTEIYKNNSQKGLSRILKRIKKNSTSNKHVFKTISSFNMLSDEIRTQVKDKEIDLIIMGTQGATGAEEILFGTHTVHAIKKTKCPLLAIPSQFEYRLPKEILFPTDYEKGLPELLMILKELALRHSSKLHILHVYFGPALSEEQEKIKKELAEMFPENSRQFYSIAEKSVSQAIYDFQTNHEIDFLVMVNHKHSFFENLLFKPVINKMGFHVKVPFLVIPSGKK